MIDQTLVRDVHLKANPILRRELNKIPLPIKRHTLQRYFWIVVTLVTAATLVISYGGGMSYCSRYYRACSLSDLTLYSINQSLFPVIAIGSLLVGLLFDFYFVSLPAGRLLREKQSGHWELLRTTPFPITQIVASKYATAQFRAWRVLAVEVALRGAVSVIIVGSFLLSYTTESYGTNAGIFLSEITFFVIISLVYVLEPVWRMRMLVSMGLAIAMQMRSVTSVALADLGALLAMRIVQAVLVFLYILGISLLIRMMNPNYASSFYSEWFYLFVTGGFGACIYVFYRLGRRWLLRRALRLSYPVYR
ncbi:MAG TPA: hypothetical protein VKQ72_09785 [Aggregatilineales bacterium]|nr:hypothetical protein [Aggregatilineales bacterium]